MRKQTIKKDASNSSPLAMGCKERQAGKKRQKPKYCLQSCVAIIQLFEMREEGGSAVC